MSAAASSLLRSQPGRRWVAVLVVLGVLLGEFALPPRLAPQGPSIVVYLVVLGALALSLRRPWLGLALLLAYGPFAAGIRFAGASNFQSLAKDLFGLAIVGMWLIDVVLSRRQLARSPLDVPLLLYFGLALVQAFRAPSLLRGALELKILFVCVPVYFFVYHNPLRSRRQLQALLVLLLSVAVVTALYGIYQYVTLSGTTSITAQIEGHQFYVSLREGHFRVFSTFTHSVAFSLYLALMGILAVTLSLRASPLVRSVLLAILVLLIAVSTLTLSRLGWVAFALGLVTLGALAQQRSRRALLAIIGIAAVVVLFYLSPQATKETLGWSFTDEDVSFNIRQALIGWAYRMTFVEIPLGCGLGTQADSADVTSRVTGVYESPYPCTWNGYGVTGADTVALTVGVQMGALGWLLFAWIHLVILRQGLRIYRLLEDPFLKTLAAGLVSYLVVMTFSNFLSGNTTTYPIVDLYFWFFVGLLLSLPRIELAWTPAAPQEAW